MAKLKKGILGHFSGKLGNVVGSSWNGIPVIRTVPVNKKECFSRAQVEQRAKFLLLVDFFKPVSTLLQHSFANTKLRMSGFHKAVSSNFGAIIGEYPGYRLNFAHVTLCKCIFEGRQNVIVEEGSDGQLIFILDKLLQPGSNDSYKLLFIAAYAETSRQWIYQLKPEIMNDIMAVLNVNAFRSKTVHTYAGIIEAGGKYPKSLYTGTYLVP